MHGDQSVQSDECDGMNRRSMVWIRCGQLLLVLIGIGYSVFSIPEWSRDVDIWALIHTSIGFFFLLCAALSVKYPRIIFSIATILLLYMLIEGVRVMLPFVIHWNAWWITSIVLGILAVMFFVFFQALIGTARKK